MDRRTVLTLSTAAVLSGLYALYGVVFGPLLSPRLEINRRAVTRSDDAPARDLECAREAAEHLPEQIWAADAAYQAHFGRSIVFAEKWEMVENEGREKTAESRRVRFRPFAMIWRSADQKPDEAPLTIVSESAVVEFAQKFSITNPHPGRVVGGALEGKVTVRGAENLALDGQTFHFSEDALRVWSDHPLKFARGPHTGRASGLELALIRQAGPPEPDRPAVSGVRTVRLLKDVEMHLVSETKGASRPAERVRVTCAGSFEYGVETHVAVFQKQVRVVRPTGNNQSDTLENCDLLTLMFEPNEAPQADAAPRAAERPRDGDPLAMNLDLKFRRLRAEGPATIARSQRSDLVARMQELVYDEGARLVALRDAREVHLVQADSEVFCPEITAQLDEDGQIDETECRGAGRIFRYQRNAPQSGKPGQRPVEFEGKWLKLLRLGPDSEPDSDLDEIILVGDAWLSQPLRMNLQADRVKLWVTPVRKSADGPARKDDGRTDTGEQTRLKRMLAVGQAKFASPQITGHSDELKIWFEEGRLPQPPEVSGNASLRRNALRVPPKPVARGRAGQPAGERPVRSTAAKPVADARRQGATPATVASGSESARKSAAGADAPGATKESKSRAANPPHVVAQSIQVLAMVDGDDTQVAQVITDGQVHVRQERRPGEPPFELRGDHLHLKNYSERHQVVRVQGAPAQISDRALQLEGKDIHFDRARNEARVAGAGVLRIPVSRGIDGKPLDQPQRLDIFWTEKMDFDGETAKFYRNVQTRMDGSELKCEEMHVLLDRRIDFAEDAEGSPETGVRFIRCHDGVKLSSHEYEGNRLVQIRTAEGFEFAFDYASGDMTAQGPGTLRFWQRGAGNRAALKAPSGAKANKPLATETTEWDYTRIEFKGHMQGNSNRRSTTFHKLVDVVYGPVNSATDIIDVDKLPLNGGWMRCDELELTQYEKSATNDAYVVVVGRHNVELEGRSEQGLFSGMAQTITFDQSKGLYTLTGDGLVPAEVWREVRPGINRSAGRARRMEFNPGLNAVRINESSGAQGSG
ncbi:MAG: hypothetical protein ACT4QC_11595 [Planctomycetaceae bacterium]